MNASSIIDQFSHDTLGGIINFVSESDMLSLAIPMVASTLMCSDGP